MPDRKPKICNSLLIKELSRNSGLRFESQEQKVFIMKCALSGRSVLDRNLSEMRKYLRSWCFLYMLVWLLRKSHDQNWSYVGFKYSVHHVYVGWQLQMTGAGELLCTVNGRTSRYGPTDRPTKPTIRRSIYFHIYYWRIVCTRGFEKVVLHLLITPFNP